MRRASKRCFCRTASARAELGTVADPAIERLGEGLRDGGTASASRSASISASYFDKATGWLLIALGAFQLTVSPERVAAKKALEQRKH